jgi:dephospho-CoA kinase
MVRSPALLRVGLTGGIGAGKSSVARLLRDKGAVVIDTDAIAREVTRSGAPSHTAILGRFGPAIEGPDGEIDRTRLAEIVFGDPAARADLNAIVHPAVAAAVDARLATATMADIVVLEVPLLLEAGWASRVDLVLVVDCPEEVAVRRLVEERGMAEADVRRRVAAQATREERLEIADVVILNDGSIEELERRVDEAWSALLERAQGA